LSVIDTWMPAWRLRDLIERREISPVDVARHYIERLPEADQHLHAFLTVCAEEAEIAAHGIEAGLLKGEPPGPLCGIPIAIKDELCTRGVRTTAGSLTLSGYVPAEDAVLVERVKSAGAIMVGKTNLPEFAMQPRTWNLLGAECANPWDHGRASGGSSGGTAASIGAGMVPLGIGSDGGGSARIPAALCGICAVLPTNGRVPRHGSLSGGSLFLSSDAAMARTVRDMVLLFSVLAGFDNRDPTSVTLDPPDYLRSLEDGVGSLRMAWVADCGGPASLNSEVVQTVRQAASRFGELGARLSELNATLEADRWYDALFTISNCDRFVAIGQRLYEDPESRRLLTAYAVDAFARAEMISGAEYSRALAARVQCIQMFRTILDGYDLLLTPTVAITAPDLTSPLDRPSLISFCFPVNLAGFPAATVPCGFVAGLPVGLQIIARPHHEELIFRACRSFEQLQPWIGRVPF
jgi:Asp-tRNA(Asn)/Glu-tRNA(Gln) amidotransferase A subunit family amidase